MKTKTKEMIEREKATGNEFIIDEEGYGILKGKFYGEVIYISLPEGHPCIDKSYDDFNIEVNGGLTFGAGNVFGWDYAHYENDFNFEEHIRNALNFFKSRE